MKKKMRIAQLVCVVLLAVCLQINAQVFIASWTPHTNDEWNTIDIQVATSFLIPPEVGHTSDRAGSWSFGESGDSGLFCNKKGPNTGPISMEQMAISGITSAGTVNGFASLQCVYPAITKNYTVALLY
eukprot:TRINITY_DN12521_c0_g2_i1.p1 TRINITY_DN12521_c0_g2~~TRINITY_DN12521_c0_g2_i1.p1  ORF type:complete len:128 (-),score=16.50 TRINITY_DN12521_c0_g2_i1:83-466(-)